MYMFSLVLHHLLFSSVVISSSFFHANSNFSLWFRHFLRVSSSQLQCLAVIVKTEHIVFLTMLLFSVSVENITTWPFILMCHHTQSSNAAKTRISHMDNNSKNSYMTSWKHLESCALVSRASLFLVSMKAVFACTSNSSFHLPAVLGMSLLSFAMISNINFFLFKSHYIPVLLILLHLHLTHLSWNS